MTFSPSIDAASLTDPNNVFELQNHVSDNLNMLQDKYSRYVRCQNDKTAENVDPPCDLTSSDNFRHLTDAYEKLYSSLDKLENVYDDQVIDNKTNESYDDNEEELEKFYEKTKKMRKELDEKLKYIQSQANVRTAPTYRVFESRVLINTLLIILLFYLVYVLFFDVM